MYVMTVEEELKIIKKARERIAELDLEKARIYKEVKDQINPEGPLESFLWDHICNGISSYKHDIAKMLEVRKKWLD
jgi:hypothetical protein